MAAKASPNQELPRYILQSVKPALFLAYLQVLLQVAGASSSDVKESMTVGTVSISQSISSSRYPPVTAMFVFGDSLSDVGNNQYGPPRIHRGCSRWYPYGIDFIPKSGRCSDGKLMVDYLGEMMAH